MMKTVPGEESMLEAVALQQIAMNGAMSMSLWMVQIFKYSWQKHPGKSTKIENHDVQELWKIRKSRYDDTLRSHLRSKLQSLWTAWRWRWSRCFVPSILVLQNEGNSTGNTHNNTTCYDNGLRPWSKYVAKFSPVESLHNLGLKMGCEKDHEKSDSWYWHFHDFP